jgi:hypothetical protein
MDRGATKLEHFPVGLNRWDFQVWIGERVELIDSDFGGTNGEAVFAQLQNL